MEEKKQEKVGGNSILCYESGQGGLPQKMKFNKDFKKKKMRDLAILVECGKHSPGRRNKCQGPGV